MGGRRRPVVLAPEARPAWLGEEPADEAHLKSLLASVMPNPYAMCSTPASRRVVINCLLTWLRATMRKSL